MVEQGGRAVKSTRVISRRVGYRACHVQTCRAVHVLGAKSCSTSAPCPAHYGVCLPVHVTLVDPLHSSLGSVALDVEAVRLILEKKKKRKGAAGPGASSSDSSKYDREASPSSCSSSSYSAERGAAPTCGASDQMDSAAPRVRSRERSPAVGRTSSQCEPQRSLADTAEDLERVLEAVKVWALDSTDPKPELPEVFRVTLAELAATNRAGRVAPGPDAPATTSRHHRHHEPVQLFSELMQTDDVSTIAAQIANQAELIYQTWKTTGLNPTDLIKYHSVPSSEGGLFEQDEQVGGGGGPPSSSSHSPSIRARTPIRNISPAPPGSSPAISRKFIEQSPINGRAGSAPPSTSAAASASASALQPLRSLNTSPRPYVPPSSPSSAPHPSSFPAAPTGGGAALGGSPFVPQAAPHSPRLNYSSPPSPVVQSGPRPYVSPTLGPGLGPGYPVAQAAPQSPRVVQPQTQPQPLLPQSAPQSPREAPPPPPPERSSSYSGVEQQSQTNPFELLADPGLEESLRNLVNTFVLEDKARHAATLASSTRLSERPKSAPSSIQDALQRFERQMAITSRVTSHAAEKRTEVPITIVSSSPPSSSSSPSSAASSPAAAATGACLSNSSASSPSSNSRFPQHVAMSNSSSSSSTSTASVNVSPMSSPGGRVYGGSRSDSKLLSNTEHWQRIQAEHNARARRSVSPNPPPVSQPGWNEAPQSSTSTWPLKNKQPMQMTVATTEKRSVQTTTHAHHVSANASSSASTSSTSSSESTTNYITTLETRVESAASPSKHAGIPLRHKVIAMSDVDKEEEKLLHALRTGTVIEEGDELRPTSQSVPVGGPMGSPFTPGKPEAAEVPAQGRRKNFSISVTVDVENKKETWDAQHQKMQMQSTRLQKQQSSSSTSTVSSPTTTRESSPVPSRPPGEPTGNSMSMVDYAKVRFQDAQQHPRTSQRLEDYRTISAKPVVNGDGRVMMARSRFENGSASIPDAQWRGTTAPIADEVGSTLPEYYRRKLRKMRKAGSPEPLGSISALPHPELTDQQKAHIRERSQSPTTGYNSAGVAIRPFLTQGSVAERVLIFERAPTEMKPKPVASVPIAPLPERKKPNITAWRDPDEVRAKAQETLSPPSTPRQVVTPPPANLETIDNTYVNSNSLNKENAVPSIINNNTSTTNNNNNKGLSIPPESSEITTSATFTPGVPLHCATPSSGTGSPTVSPSSIPPLASAPSLSSPVQSPRGGTFRRHAKANKNLLIPRFYYPMGRPTTQATQEAALARVAACFRENNGQITRENMEPLMRAAQIPLYWKAPLFIAAGGDKLGYLPQEQFLEYWGRVISTCHDQASRFVRVLSRGVRNYLEPEDFLTMIQDVVDTHPGLTFLKEATEFHSRYVHTVIARIYYCVNRSWSGRITIPEIRRSNLLQVISYTEEEEDINQITDYFSYEHFYVIYCKFWELDTDHDLFIDKHDLAKHNERALSWRMIERIFSGAVTRGRVQKQDRMGYQEFVWFLISEEDKRHPTAIEYWFRCMDLDGDGYLSMYELEYFYEEQLQRMEALGIETLPFQDCLCQMLDMVRPEMGDKISLTDLKGCRMTPIFFDTFFNLEKYLDHEQRDPFASHHAEDEGPEVSSDWDRYAAEEYELLVAEEGGADHQDDMMYGEEDELSMGCDDALDDVVGGMTGSGGVSGVGGGVGSSLTKHSPLSATVTNLADPMVVDDDYPDYADSDDY